jgi:NAD dependent epimerase/dehydratase family enzyme
MKVIIAGGSGQIGSILARHFHREGHAVVVLSRRMQSVPWQTHEWDGSTLGPWVMAIEASDVLINLAGRSVNCRYTKQNRQEILGSRVRSTLVLHQAIASLRSPPAVWLNASTATIYRHAVDRPMDEALENLAVTNQGRPTHGSSRFRLQRPGRRRFSPLMLCRPGRWRYAAR